ncbi:MAG: UDP-glucose 4-epimerase GalE [Pseudomonadota bacterium]
MSSASPVPILVTGGAGYVGAHACKALAARGYLPVVYDNLVYGHREAAKWGPLEVGDIADRATLDAVIDRHRPVAVMHFAAFTYVGESVADPGKYYRNNVAGTLSLLEAIRDHKIDRLVFSSTAAVYGTPESVPIREDAPKLPINPYGQSKWTAEQMIADFSAAHAIRAARLRYFNAAGADPENQIGEQHDPESHLIPLAMQAVTGDGPPLTLFGDDYPTPDGTCIRDYIHVSDLADAHVRALDWLADNPGAHAMNLGTGRGQSVRQVIDAVERVAGRPVPHGIGPRRSGDPAELVSDPSLAMRQLGWNPQLSDLDTIVNTAWAWHRRGK